MTLYSSPEKKTGFWKGLVCWLTMAVFWSPALIVFVGGWLLALGMVPSPSGGVIIMALITYIAVWIFNLGLRISIEDEGLTEFKPGSTLVNL